MPRRSPVALLLAALVLILAYGWTIVLFAIGAMLGIGVFTMVPIYLATIPVTLRWAHERARSLAQPRVRAARLGVELRHAAPSQEPQGVLA